MKSRKSILDPFAARLEEWAAEGKTLAEIQAQLKADGCQVSIGRLSAFLESLRQARLRERMFALIASGGRMNQDLDKAFGKNPAPDIATLINVTKTLVMSLQVQGAANPEMLSLANSMQQTVLAYLTGKTKAELEFKKLDLATEKFQRDTCELFLKWLEDKNAREIAASNLSHSDKIEKLGKTMFGEDW